MKMNFYEKGTNPLGNDADIYFFGSLKN